MSATAAGWLAYGTWDRVLQAVHCEADAERRD